MTILNRPFRDSSGLVGKSRLTSTTAEIPVVYKNKSIHLEIRSDGYLHIDVLAVVSSRIHVGRTDAIALANWILSNFDKKSLARKRVK